jgi:Domain of unknown function (DUF5605)/Domain of unknown function (DUF5060)/Protein of unknown function (DUF4038)
MSVSPKTKIGRILGDPEGRQQLFLAIPDLAGSKYIELLRGMSIERLAGLTGHDEAWTLDVIDSLEAVHLEQRHWPHDLLSAPEGYESEGVPRGSAKVMVQSSAPRWGIEEVVLLGPSHGNPFVDVEVGATFRNRDHEISVHGFYDGAQTYRIRFMPTLGGEWTFSTWSSARSLDGITGSFTCTAPEAEAHGPVGVSERYHFSYADGSPFRPFGTTCYAWSHQGEELAERTLDTLAHSTFNKLRMCVFPKSYVYNDGEPPLHAFVRLEDGSFDYTRPNLEFFRNLENKVERLAHLGIEADVILFHPYDRWGYSEMSVEADVLYLSYVVTRISAYANVWWSLANEFDLLWDKTEEDWMRFGSLVHQRDPYGHLTSIHQAEEFFDHSQPWITHCSIQTSTVDRTIEWRTTWNKPVILDECGYEGDIEMPWGNLTGKEMVRRCWEGVARGGYVGHGETYINEGDQLWWSKGGALEGSSPLRIGFLRSLMEAAPDLLEPVPSLSHMGYQTIGKEGEYYLQYIGAGQPSRRSFDFPEDESYRVDVIDTWNMTVRAVGVHTGTFEITLPSRPHLAVRLTRVASG